MNKVGRNDPCPCGSGRKFKKCCLAAAPVRSLADPEVRPVEEDFRKHMREEAQRRRRFGHGKPIISATHKGHKFVAVGNRNGARSQISSLITFESRWARNGGKLRRPSLWPSATPCLKWFHHFIGQQKGLTPDNNELYSVVPDGITAAYLLLAYDLYALDHHGKLQAEVVRRLKIKDQFRGARYELFVAATFVRADFDFEYEDEKDGRKKHPEFAARHRGTGFMMAVEAKARHRDVVAAAAAGAGAVRAGVQGLLRNAAGEKSQHPLVVFVELDLPPEDATRSPSWIPDVQGDLAAIAAENSGKDPFGLTMFTNRPHQYGSPGEPDASRHFYALWPATSPIPEALIDALGEAVRQYGNVPQEFHGEPSFEQEVG